MGTRRQTLRILDHSSEEDEFLSVSSSMAWTGNQFFTARRSYANAVLGVIILSIRLSVARVLCVKTNNALRIFLYHTKGQLL